MDLKLWQNRFAEYMQMRNWSHRTVGGYAHALVRFFDFLAGQEVRAVAEITRDVVTEYRTHLYHVMSQRTGGRLAARTQVRHLCAIKAFCRFLAHERYVLMDAGAALEIPKVADTLPRVLLSEEEMMRLMAAPDVSLPLGVRDRAVLELLYCSAIRNSELCSLQTEDVDVRGLELHVVEGKGAKSRRVPLGEEAALWLERYVQETRAAMLRQVETPALFLNRRGKPMDREALTLIVRQAGERAGIAHTVTPHVIRHACATHLLAHGMGLRHLQMLLGHSSVESTQRYLRIEISDLKEVHRRCHPREKAMPV